MGGECSTYGGGEVHAEFLYGNLKEEDYLEGLGLDGRIILRWIFKNWDGARTGLMWLRIVTGGEVS
jgi:hypothetical protein